MPLRFLGLACDSRRVLAAICHIVKGAPFYIASDYRSRSSQYLTFPITRHRDLVQSLSHC
jgi:hypothetical protein